MNTIESRPVEASLGGSSQVALPEGATRIDFLEIRENYPDTWEEAIEIGIGQIESSSGRLDLFLVESQEGDVRLDNCSLVAAGEVYHGWCSCKKFQDIHACPHLCAIRQAAAVGEASIPTLVKDGIKPACG